MALPKQCPKCEADLTTKGSTFVKPGWKRFVYHCCTACGEQVKKAYYTGSLTSITKGD